MSDKIWRSRGYIPHCDHAGYVQHIVFGLADAVSGAPESDDTERRTAWWDAQFDRGAGACLLRGDAATIVEEALLHFDGERYRLLGWCVMPNHVHVLAEQFASASLDRVVHGWKSWTANAINRLHGRTGRLWRREYFDRYMRTDEQFWTTRRYIEMNPVAAGLCHAPHDWPWSSASR